MQLTQEKNRSATAERFYLIDKEFRTVCGDMTTGTDFFSVYESTAARAELAWYLRGNAREDLLAACGAHTLRFVTRFFDSTGLLLAIVDGEALCPSAALVHLLPQKGTERVENKRETDALSPVRRLARRQGVRLRVKRDEALPPAVLPDLLLGTLLAAVFVAAEAGTSLSLTLTETSAHLSLGRVRGEVPSVLTSIAAHAAVRGIACYPYKGHGVLKLALATGETELALQGVRHPEMWGEKA